MCVQENCTAQTFKPIVTRIASSGQHDAVEVVLVPVQGDRVEVLGEPGGGDHGHVDEVEDEEYDHRREVHRAGDLAVAEDPLIPLEPVVQGGGHGQAGEDRQRRGDEHDREVAELLYRVEAEVAARLGGQVERRVLDDARACRGQDRPLGRDELEVLLGGERQDDEHDPVDDEQDVEDEVPVARDADRVPPAGKAEQRAQRDRVVLGRPHPVLGDRAAEPQPFRVGRAVHLEVQPGVIGQDLPAGPDDPHHEDKVQQVRDYDPDRYPRREARRRLHARMGLDERLSGAGRDEPLEHRHVSHAEHEDPRQQQPHRDEARAQPEVDLAEPHPRVSAFLAQQRLTGERPFRGVAVVAAGVSQGNSPSLLPQRSPGAPSMRAMPLARALEAATERLAPHKQRNRNHRAARRHHPSGVSFTATARRRFGANEPRRRRSSG